MKPPWVIPPKANAAFVANMEDVRDTYAMPSDSKRPVVCVDERGKPLIGDVREPRPVRPGSPAEEDWVYERGGMANLFLAFEPRAGKRLVEVTARKTGADFARFRRVRSDGHDAAAGKIVSVWDNLSTHTPAARYAAFAPAEAGRLAERFEWHDTPTHGSWRNVAEMERSVLAGPCLDRRTPDAAALKREVAAWEKSRNAAVVKVDWQFTTADARVRLEKLYPTIELQ